MDYADAFNEHLEERLRAGGEPDRMVGVARVYAGDDHTLRDYAFREWLYGRQFHCSTCRAMFGPSGDIDRWDEVLCAKCVARKEDCK